MSAALSPSMLRSEKTLDACAPRLPIRFAENCPSAPKHEAKAAGPSRPFIQASDAKPRVAPARFAGLMKVTRQRGAIWQLRH